MAASMCSSSTAVDEPFNGGGELMEALEPFTIKAASLLPPPPPSSLPSLFPSENYSFYPSVSSFSFSSPSVSYPYDYDSGFGSSPPTIMSSNGCSTSGTHMFSSQRFTGFRFEQPGYIGLNQLTPTQIKIKQIQAQINQQLLPPHHDMSSAAKGNQCCILKKILELVLASARVNPFAEHILFHMEAIGDDLPFTHSISSADGEIRSS
nr:ethylene-responsive transcription factor RAP2-4-like [Ipomoea batatas]